MQHSEFPHHRSRLAFGLRRSLPNLFHMGFCHALKPEELPRSSLGSGLLNQVQSRCGRFGWTKLFVYTSIDSIVENRQCHYPTEFLKCLLAFPGRGVNKPPITAIAVGGATATILRVVLVARSATYVTSLHFCFLSQLPHHEQRQLKILSLHRACLAGFWRPAS